MGLDLKELTTAELRDKWREVIGNDAPVHLRRNMLEKHIIWHMQAKEYGGLSKKTERELKRLVAEFKEHKTIKQTPTLQIKSGTKLYREYQGTNHEVTVSDGGYIYNNKTYKSLSAIAREITGTRWNGKLFFGVNK